MNIFIVEDENFIREGLSFFINRNFTETLHVFSYATGEDMLLAAKDIPPDIVLSDINLPGMSGIEAVRELKKFHQFKVIFLSGYDDFQYLQSAIQIGAEDYILKPIDYKNLKLKLSQTMQALSMKRQVDYSIKYNQLLNLILAFDQQMTDRNIYSFEYFIVNINQTKNTGIPHAHELFHFNIFGEPIEIMNTDLVLSYGQDNQIVLQRKDLHDLNQAVLELLLKKHLNTGVTAVNKRKSIFDKQIFTNEVKLQEFMAFLQNTDIDFQQRLEFMITFLLQYSIHFNCLETYNSAQKIIGIHHQMIKEDNLSIIVNSYIEPLVDKILNLHGNRDDLSKKIIDYIYTHFDDPQLDLNYLSGIFNKSQANLSILIKKSIDKNFIHLLNELRIDKAKQLLVHSNKRNNEIASLVGYSNEEYFSKVFKKYVGMTPAKYRTI
ncbi:response regulator transcription factor [Lysinibacillus pakistanensis]|uniref:response regulator transcription factor n=1 Tax=Lysinibacillus pakistanensis TaxID=759811 RepID=UPI003D2873DA